MSGETVSRPKPRNQDWNSINVSKLIVRDEREVQRLQDLTRSYFLWFFAGNEDLYNRFLLTVVLKAHQHKPSAKFSGWIYTIATNIRKRPDPVMF